MMISQQTVEIRQFIIDNVRIHGQSVIAMAAARFKVSRQAIHRHVTELCKAGVIKAQGTTRARVYALCVLAELEFDLDVCPALQDDVPWRERIKPLLTNVPTNVLAICAYGFTEILNNAIDHSEAKTITVRCFYTAESVRLNIIDTGVGIFKKIKQAFRLAEEREAILELAKGKLTTDPARHSGEGIFFTSRMVDLFSIWSGELYFTHSRRAGDWLLQVDHSPVLGTNVELVVSLRSILSPKDVFEQYTEPDSLSFSKTHVPLSLAQFGPDNLLSRSQAKRILTRFNRFSEVLLDFAGVDFIGQAFSDEIFRVFQNANPDVKLLTMNANPVVNGMIQRAITNRQQGQ